MDTSRAFNDFFYRSEAEKPSWMSGDGRGADNGEEEREEEVEEVEERLLDDAYSSYMSRALSGDSRMGSTLDSQESVHTDREMEAEVQELVLRVAMCCGKCETKAKFLTQLEGVASVVCDRNAEKVTVTGSARPRDILEACRKFFPQAKLWSPDDPLSHPNPNSAAAPLP